MQTDSEKYREALEAVTQVRKDFRHKSAGDLRDEAVEFLVDHGQTLQLGLAILAQISTPPLTEH